MTCSFGVTKDVSGRASHLMLTLLGYKISDYCRLGFWAQTFKAIVLEKLGMGTSHPGQKVRNASRKMIAKAVCVATGLLAQRNSIVRAKPSNMVFKECFLQTLIPSGRSASILCEVDYHVRTVQGLRLWRSQDRL